MTNNPHIGSSLDTLLEEDGALAEVPDQNEATLDQALEGRVGQVQFQPSNLSTSTKDAFTDLLIEKYRLPGLEDVLKVWKVPSLRCHPARE